MIQGKQAQKQEDEASLGLTISILKESDFQSIIIRCNYRWKLQHAYKFFRENKENYVIRKMIITKTR